MCARLRLASHMDLSICLVGDCRFRESLPARRIETGAPGTAHPSRVMREASEVLRQRLSLDGL